MPLFLEYTIHVKKLEIVFGALRVPLDALMVAAALILSYKLRVANVDLVPSIQLLDPAVSLPPFDYYLRTFVIGGALLFVAVAALLRLYAFYGTSSGWSEVGRALLAVLVWFGCVMAWYFLVRKQLFYSRVLLLHSVAFIAVFVVSTRALLTMLYRSLLHRGYGVRFVVSFGSRGLTESAMRTLHDDPRYAFAGHVKNLAQLRGIHEHTPLDLVLQTDPHPTSAETESLIEECRSKHITYAFLPPVLAEVPQQLTVERLGMLPMIRLTPTPLDGWGRVLKRASDVVISTILLVLLLPVFAIIALAIFLESGFPIFYVSRRVGDQGRCVIPVLKFRSMEPRADARKDEMSALNHRSDGPLFKVKNDPRVTPLGRFLRRWSLDELPQLLNVLIGHMSIVGPRPHLPQEVQYYTPYQCRVFAVRPGITGLSQISGRSDLRFEDEVRLDLQYIEEWSPLLDLWILWRTGFTVMGREGAD